MRAGMAGQPGDGPHASERFLEAWPEIAPGHVIEFAESAQITGAVVAPDGSVAYAQLHVDAIDWWLLATKYWPEVLGGAVVLVALVVLVATVRVARRPRRKGTPYCRRCNYDLGEHVSREDGGGRRIPWVAGEGVRCPECGVVLRGRTVVTGRGLVRRCAAAWGVLLLVAGGYGAMFAAGVARGDERLQWFPWASPWAATTARARGIAWLVSEIRPINRIAVVDVATGERLGNLWQGGEASYSAPTLSPDGRVLLVRDGMSGVVVIRTRDGRRLRGLRTALVLHAYPMSDPVAQFAGGSEVAYLVAVDAERTMSQLVSWNLRTGRAAVVAETVAHRDPTRPVQFQVEGRWFSVAEVDGRVMAVSAPGFAEGYASTRGRGATALGLEGTTELHTLEPMGRRALDVTIASISRPMVLTGRGVLVDFPTFLDVRTGERALAPVFWEDDAIMGMTVRHSDFDPTHRLIVFSSHRRMDVLDLETGALLSTLTYPERYIEPRINARTCERWAVAVGFRRDRGAPAVPYVDALMLFDLGPMREQLAREDAWRAEREGGAGGG